MHLSQIIGAIFALIGVAFLSFAALCVVGFVLTAFGWQGTLGCIVAAFLMGYFIYKFE